MIIITFQRMVIRCRLIIRSLIFFILISLMSSLLIVITVCCSFFPSIERSRKRCDTMIPNFVYTSTNFAEHIEVFTAGFFKCRDKSSVKCITADMFYCINTESIYTHFDISCICVNQVFLNFSIFSIQVNTVFMDCTCLTSFIFPVFKPACMEIFWIKKCKLRPLEIIKIILIILSSP